MFISSSIKQLSHHSFLYENLASGLNLIPMEKAMGTRLQWSPLIPYHHLHELLVYQFINVNFVLGLDLKHPIFSFSIAFFIKLFISSVAMLTVPWTGSCLSTERRNGVGESIRENSQTGS